MKRFMTLDYFWLAGLGLAGLLYCLFAGGGLFFSSILLSGVLCVGLIAIGRKEGYLVGLYNSCAYSWVAYQNGLFGEVILNLLFFIPTGIIGFFIWKRHAAQVAVSMRRLTWVTRAVVAVVCLCGIAFVGWLLGQIPTQNTPYVDASTNVLSIIATFLMMWRYKEQWLLYMVLNVISVVMWVLRWQADGVAGDMMIFMWLLFLANSVFGYWRWSVGASVASQEVAV